MVTVKVDGNVWNANISTVRTMSELVELIKSNIDPDKIITSMSINGESLTEGDWRAPLTVQGDNTLDVTTGTVDIYIRERLRLAIDLVQEITEEFGRARECYQQGGTRDANTFLSGAVSNLHAFLDWYHSILLLAPEQQKENIESFKGEIGQVNKICEQILQQQLYQSWWALGQTLQSKLEPRLDEMKSFCEKCSADGGAAVQ